MKNRKPLSNLFPKQRMYRDFPWQVWGVGWFVILKGVIWLSIDTHIPDTRLIVWGYKYLFCMIPLIIFGIGIWNLKIWAVWGAAILCILELLLFILYPISSVSLGLNTTSMTSIILSSIVFVINWPISNVLVLLASPVIFKYSHRNPETHS